MRHRRPVSAWPGFLALGLTLFLAAFAPPACRVSEARDRSASTEEQKKDFVVKYETAKYLVSAGQLKEAHAQLKKLKRQARGDVEKALAEEAYASYYLAKRELSDAEKHASAAVDLHPAFAAGFRTRALVRLGRGNSRGAEEDFRSALSFDGSDVKCIRGLAELYLAQKRDGEALPLLERYLEVDPLDAWAQDTWARLMAADLGYEALPLDYLRSLKNATVSRAELAAILVVALDAAERRGASPGPEPSSPRPSAGSPAEADAPEPGHDPGTGSTDYEGRWYTPFVEKSLARGLMRLYPDGSFRPEDWVKKGLLANEVYSFLARSAPAKVDAVLVRPMEALAPAGSGEEPPRVPGTGYSDVFILSYLWRPVRVAVELGLLESESSTAFGVNSTVSGREAARLAENLARLVHSP